MNEIQRRKKENNYLLWIAKIINEDVKNSNIKNVTVVDAKLSNDGSDLKVYVLFNQNKKRSLEVMLAQWWNFMAFSKNMVIGGWLYEYKKCSNTWCGSSWFIYNLGT